MNVSALKGRSLLTWANYTAEEIRLLLDLAKKLKAESRKKRRFQRFAGKTLVLLLDEDSLVTRSAFETAFGEEGGHTACMPGPARFSAEKEGIADWARALGRLYDGILYRGPDHAVVESLAKHADVPVFNGMTDRYHPTRALADVFTIEEALGTLKGKRLVYMGDGRNSVASSLLVLASKLGMDLCVSGPSTYWPARELWDICQGFAGSSGSSLSVTADHHEAVHAADVIYADSIGTPGSFRVDESLMAGTGSDSTIFLQRLPAAKASLVGSEVFEGQKSRVFDQVENGRHVVKAILLATL